MSAEVQHITGQEAVLIPGGGGIFDVTHEGNLIFSKHRLGRFPEPGEIAGLISED